MAKLPLTSLVVTVVFTTCLLVVHHRVYGEHIPPGKAITSGRYHDQIRKLQAFKSSLTTHDSIFIAPSAISPSPSSTSPPQGKSSSRIYQVTSYGADPTGKSDSTQAILAAMADAVKESSDTFLMEGIANIGGAQIDLEGGNYMVSKPLRFPSANVGNLMIHGGTIRASDDFPTDGYLIDLSPPSSQNGGYNYEYITIRDILLDSNYRGGGIAVINSLRTSIDNCYIAHFMTNGIIVHDGHETYIRNSFLGQHITAGGDKGERNFSGTAISLLGNDNAVTDVVIFSASTGIVIGGQANTLSGVHCYNKATGFGGTGIYVKLPGLSQTRITNSYLDYTGIVAEDPVQLHITNSFFLGDAYILLKSINGVARGVNIVDNMFSGSNHGVEIVQLDESNGPFKDVDQVVVDRNNVRGMNLKATVAKGYVEGNSTSWTVDFSRVLLFPDLIRHVQYSFVAVGDNFPFNVLRKVSGNRVLVESNLMVPARVFVTVDQ